MLTVSRIDIIEVGTDKPFSVTYTSEPGGLVFMMMVCNSDSIHLLQEDGSLAHYSIENRAAEEYEPERFSYVIRVRKHRPVWYQSGT
jgi:hypothetical protein